MDKQSLVQAISHSVESAEAPDYSSWTIGLTHDPTERKNQHESDGKWTTYWEQWVADSLSEAQEIESFFINQKGMKGGPGGDLSSRRTVYVYIF